MDTLSKAKAKVVASHPRAWAEKRKRQGMGAKSYWLVWNQLSGGGVRLGAGSTEREAWNKAAETIERDMKSQDQTINE